jgi:hypothetical protein
VHAIDPKGKVEALGDVGGTSNIECCTRNGKVSDQAVYRAARELNRSRYQYKFARTRAIFHEALINQNFLGIDKSEPINFL